MLARLMQISDRASATWRYLPVLAVCLAALLFAFMAGFVILMPFG
jgi:hypothetical protein